jgi:hypothetical protein
MEKLFARAIAVKLSNFDVLSNFNKIIKTYCGALQRSAAERRQA